MDSNTNAKVSRFENLAVYFLLAAASVLSSLALLRPGFIQGHDLPFQLTLVAEYASCLGQGVFPVRWAPHLEAGYGNPMFIFSPPLFPLVASVWALLSGGQLLIGIKAALLILKFIGLLGMYRLSGVFFGKKSGLVSALFFAFAPYVAIDLFTRDAFQEFAGLCLIPWVFYSMARILTELRLCRRQIVSAAVWTGLFLTAHPLSWILYLPLLGVFILLNARWAWGYRRLVAAAVAGLGALVLAAFYVVPFLAERPLIRTELLTAGRFRADQNFVEPAQIFYGQWYSLSPLTLILVAWILWFVIFSRKRLEPLARKNFVLFAAATAAALWMATGSSGFVWRHFGALTVLQFPWRFFAPATFALCFLCGGLAAGIHAMSESRGAYLARKGLTVLLAGFACLLLMRFFNTESQPVGEFRYKPDRIRRSAMSATVLNEYRPKSAGDFVPATFESRACLLSGVGRVGISTECADRFEYTLEIVEPARVLIELFYYPGWVIRVDEKPVSFERDGWGRPLLELPQGRWRLSGVFEKTSLRAWADGVSILAVLGLVLGWFLGKKTAKMAP